MSQVLSSCLRLAAALGSRKKFPEVWITSEYDLILAMNPNDLAQLGPCELFGF